MPIRQYSVWSVTDKAWCGISPNHVLQLRDTPFVNMTCTDLVVAKLRARSLSREFPDHVFVALEVN